MTDLTSSIDDQSGGQGTLPQTLEHLWLHMTEWNRLARQDGIYAIKSAKDCSLFDVNGREYIDAISGLWVVNAGHGRREIGAAMAEQAATVAYVSPHRTTTLPTVQLSQVISEITPGDLNHVFFCSGGSEAVESALKIAKQVQAMRGFPRRYKVIARRGSYHGATLAALSLTHGRNETYYGPFMYGVHHVPSPNRYRNDFGLEGETGDVMCADYVEQEIIAQGPETVAAVIGEPISIANGVHVPSAAYWRRLREICDKHGVLLIMDEVINGFGRTGKMFATEHFGMQPDILTMAKGLSSGYAPIAAVAVSDKVFDIFKEQEDVSLAHLLTFGGQAVAAAAALKNIEIIQDEDLVAQSAKKGEYLRNELEKLREHPSVGDVRGLGLSCAIELVKDKTTKERLSSEADFLKALDRRMSDKGMLTRAWDVVHVAPPLVVTYDEIDRMVQIVDESLTETEAEFRFEFRG